IGEIRHRASSMIDHAFEQIVRALGAVHAQDRIDRLEPLLRFLGIQVVAGRPERRQWSCARHDASSQWRIPATPNDSRKFKALQVNSRGAPGTMRADPELYPCGRRYDL